jgi:glycosyltransferase involved in cell wall biosynthesis
MRILYFTAGAAGMYCGSCLRDNALATELLRQGHDVMLVPLYTPTRTDEPNVSQEKVLFGGISVYLEQHSALFRHSPRWMDKLWDSQFALKQAAKSSIPVDPQALGELTVSMLKGEDGHQRKEVFKLLDWLKTQPPFDVVDFQNSMLSGLAKPIKEALRAPLCCTLQGEDQFLNNLREPYRSQALALIRENAQYVDCFIAVSHAAAALMTDLLRVPREKIKVVPLGLNLKDYNCCTPPEHWPRHEPLTIGFFARIAPEKGLHLLADAYIDLRQRAGFPAARLEAAGYLAPEHHGYLRDIEAKLQTAGYGAEFRYHGTLEREDKLRFLQSIDVFSMPTTFDESKGLSVLEALASGVPVVQPRIGSNIEMIEATGGGLFCEVNDAVSLADKLYELWRNPELARDLARRGFAGVREHYSVERMAERAISVYSLLNMVDAPMPRSGSTIEYA